MSIAIKNTMTMIRTINEHHRSAKRLFELAKKTTKERRKYLFRLARGNLRLAEAQLRNPSLRPDTRSRLSADQYHAIPEFLLASPQKVKRGRRFAELAETAEYYNWPNSSDAPFQLLTREESRAIWNESVALRLRVFAPISPKPSGITPKRTGAKRPPQGLKDDARLVRRVNSEQALRKAALTSASLARPKFGQLNRAFDSSATCAWGAVTRDTPVPRFGRRRSTCGSLAALSAKKR
jgi:hypothetical protein